MAYVNYFKKSLYKYTGTSQGMKSFCYLWQDGKKNRFIQQEQKQFLFLLILRKSVETVDIISLKRE